ncbi:MAG: pentapeptide repeat-containing protein [Sphingobacteriia bacterium]|nr:pentapeptide repeat-containing protein [Sphingobacteriia bacterium]
MSRVQYNIYHTDVDLIINKDIDPITKQVKNSFLKEIDLQTWKNHKSLREYYFYRKIYIQDARIEIDNYPFFVCFHGHNEYDFEGLDYNKSYCGDFLASNLSNILIFDTVFSNSNFDYCQFQNTIFVNVKFGKNCSFRNTDFRGAIFINCDFREVSPESFTKTIISKRSKDLQRLSPLYNFDYDKSYQEESFFLELLEVFLLQIKNEYDLELVIPKQYKLENNINTEPKSNISSSQQINSDSNKTNSSPPSLLTLTAISLSFFILSLTYFSIYKAAIIGLISLISVKLASDITTLFIDKISNSINLLTKEYQDVKEKVFGKKVINVPNPPPTTKLKPLFSFDNKETKHRPSIDKEEKDKSIIKNKIERIV